MLQLQLQRLLEIWQIYWMMGSNPPTAYFVNLDVFCDLGVFDVNGLCGLSP
jgi:hypothetical protein